MMWGMVSLILPLAVIALIISVVGAKQKGENMLRVIYTFFTGLLLATFVGVGIAAFYPQPQYPDCGERVSLYLPESEKRSETAEEKQQREDCQKLVDEHQETFKTYSRNVSLSALAAALVFMTLGLVYAEKLAIIADGLLLGGLFTLVYSIGWGFSTEDNKYRFIVVAVGLLVALGLGYLKFIRPAEDRKHR